MIDKLDLSVAELAVLSTADLATIQAGLVREEAKLKARKATFEALMLRKFETAARAGYTEAKKDTGTVTITAPGSNLLDLKVDIDKKVEWDQPKTMAWLNKQKPEDAKHFGKLEVSIPEAKYSAATPAVQAELKPLRTVKPGKMKFTFVSRDGEAAAA